MPLPSRVEDITPAWFSSILPGVTVKPETFKLTGNVQEGVGFLSMLVRVEFEADTIKEGKSGVEKFNLIIKLLPDKESAVYAECYDVVIEEKCDQVEICSYQSTIPDFVAEIPSLEKYFCKFHFGGIQEEDKANKIPYTSVLVLEDLKPLGYTTKLYNQTLLESEFAQGIDFLASFHAASKSLQEKKKVPLPEVYRFSNWMSIEDIRNGHVSTVFGMFPSQLLEVTKFLTAQNKPELIPAYKALEPKALKIFEAVLEAAQRFPCAIHTDLWSHNLLVNEDSKKPVKAIDWQLLGYGDQAYDVVVFILTTLPLESLNKSGISKAVRSYYDRYEALCSEKGIPLERTWEEFEAFFNTYGFCFALIWLVIGCAAISHVAGSENKLAHVYQFFVESGATDFIFNLA